MNVCDWVRQEARDGHLKRDYGLNKPEARAAGMLGISMRSIYNLEHEEKERLAPGKVEERDRGMEMTEDNVAEIRPAINKLIIDKKPLRLDSILMQLRVTNPEWNWERETLRKAMASIGITWRKKKDWHYERLQEDEENCLRRAHYLKFFFKYHDEGRIFNFYDQTWFNKNMVENFEWGDGTVAFDRGVPSGIGDRWIAMGCGSKENGWQRKTFQIWRGDSTTADYHGNMNWDLFVKFVDSYLDEAEDNSVFVLDRATYHTELTDDTRRATKGMTRGALCTWLLDHDAKDERGVLYTEHDLLERKQKDPKGALRAGMVKSVLYSLCRERDPKPKYKIQAIFDKYNLANPGRDLKVLILPVATPRLTPVEPMWGQQKFWVRKHNFEYTMESVRVLVMEKYEAQTVEDWRRQFNRMLRYAKEQWEADEILLEEEEQEEQEGEPEKEEEEAEEMDMAP